MDFYKLLHEYNISKENFKYTKLVKKKLIELRDDYQKQNKKLDILSQSVDNLLHNCDEVHSTKRRIKEPDHLIIKIIRKRIFNPTLNITIKRLSTEEEADEPEDRSSLGSKILRSFYP